MIASRRGRCSGYGAASLAEQRPTWEARTFTIRANAWEKSAVVCHPRICRVFHALKSWDSIKQQKHGNRNYGIERRAGGLSTLVDMPVSRDRPNGLLTLRNRETVGLRDHGRLKWETVQTMLPIQQS